MNAWFNSLTSIEVVLLTLLAMLVYLTCAAAIILKLIEDPGDPPLTHKVIAVVAAIVVWPALVYPLWRDHQAERVAAKLTGVKP